MNNSEPRAIWIWLHRYVGLIAMLFLGFAAITGCALCFVRPLDAAINADLFKAPAVLKPIDVPEAVDRFQASHPELTVRSFPLPVPVDRTIPVKVESAKKGVKLGFNQVFLDRADGRLIGTRSDDPAWTRRGAMEALHDVHYTLLAGDIGKYLMGGIALAWLISNLIGVYLTFPLRKPFWRGWKRMWRFSFKSAAPRMLLDMHRSSGLWLLVPLTVLAFTSVTLNFFAPFWMPTIQRLAPPRPTPMDGPAPFPAGTRGTLGFARAVDAANHLALMTDIGRKPATALYNPKRQLYGVSLSDDGSLNYRLLGPIYYYFRDDGRLSFVDSPYDDAGVGLTRMLYPLHSGRVFGAVGVAIVFVLGLVTALQCGTGVYIWWKKRRSRVVALRFAKRSQ